MDITKGFCYICLEIDGEIPLNLKQKDGATTLAEMITLISGVFISNSEILNKLCLRCKNRVEDAIQLRAEIQARKTKLTEMHYKRESHRKQKEHYDEFTLPDIKNGVDAEPGEIRTTEKSEEDKTEKQNANIKECRICLKRFTRTFSLRQHQLIHTDEKSFICEICSKQFITSGALKQHMVTHAAENEKRFVCDECPKSFFGPVNLRRHKLIHSSARPFGCERCGQKFSRAYYLKKHTDTVHLVIRNHVCSICAKSFSNSGNLISHFRIHTGQKPYACKYCDARFNQSTPLVRHTQTHLDRGDQPICATTTSTN